MPKIRYIIDLSDEEREHLLGVTQRGKSSVRKIKRAQMLLKASGGMGDEQIAEAVGTSVATVFRTRRRFVEEGLLALDERHRPGQPRKLDGKQEAYVIAMACSEPPKGHSHWALRLLASKVVELGFVASISPETVRQTLKKTNSSPGRNTSGASRR